MNFDLIPLVVSMDAAGAGTVTSARQLNGYITEVRMTNGGTTVTVGGTTDFTFTRAGDGGTVMTLTNYQAPFDVYPARTVVSAAGGGTTAYALGIGPVVHPGVPINDYLVMTVSSGRVSGAAATVFIGVEGQARY